MEESGFTTCFEIATHSPFRKTLKTCQALAYLPAHYVIEESRTDGPDEQEFLKYLEKNYIGRLKENKRIDVRFPIST